MDEDHQKSLLNMLTDEQKNDAVQSAKGIAKWFSLDITIRVFDHVIWSWHFPPSTKN